MLAFSALSSRLILENALPGSGRGAGLKTGGPDTPAKRADFLWKMESGNEAERLSGAPDTLHPCMTKSRISTSI